MGNLVLLMFLASCVPPKERLIKPGDHQKCCSKNIYHQKIYIQNILSGQMVNYLFFGYPCSRPIQFFYK